MKPASKLPWARFSRMGRGFRILSGDDVAAEMKGENCLDDSAYVIHCCNLYPELVEALAVLTDHARETYPHFESERGQREIAAARAILSKCEGGK